jgi:hypothetical protein
MISLRINIFCKTKSDAEKLYFATRDWLKHRLGLEINEQKSQIVNLKKRYSQFLGFKMKLNRRGTKKNGEPKYIVKSHIIEKATEKIVQKEHTLIYEIEYPKDRNGQFTATYMYNSFVIGVHNYYDMATHVQKDFRKITFPIQKSLKERLRDRLKTRGQLDNKKIKYTMPKHIQEVYGKSKQIRFVGNDKVLLPIGYVSHKKPLANAKARQAYQGAITTDHYGRAVPKHAHSTANLTRYTSSTKLVLEAVLELYERIVDKNLLIRRVNLVANHVIGEATGPKTAGFEQLNLFVDFEAEQAKEKKLEAELEREKKAQKAMLQIKKKYGKNAILKGMNMTEGATTIDRNKQIGGHKA